VDSTHQAPTRFEKHNSRKFQKANLNFPCAEWICTWRHVWALLLHYEKSGDDQSMWGDLPRFHANNAPFYMREFSVLGFW
jgi:hypothetical protein